MYSIKGVRTNQSFTILVISCAATCVIKLAMAARLHRSTGPTDCCTKPNDSGALQTVTVQPVQIRYNHVHDGGKDEGKHHSPRNHRGQLIVGSVRVLYLCSCLAHESYLSWSLTRNASSASRASSRTVYGKYCVDRHNVSNTPLVKCRSACRSAGTFSRKLDRKIPLTLDI